MTASGTPYPETPYAGSTQIGDPAPGPGHVDVSQVSVGQLVSQVTADLSTLMRQEFELAKAEVTAEAKKAGAGAGMLGGAGFAGYMAAIFGSLTLMFLLDLFLPLWAAALIVTVLYAIVGYVLYSKGRSTLKTVDPKPRQTVETLKEDVQWAKSQSR
ncbi:MAG: phage holin family protein [Actinomycetota bacterium]|nr:phage holin family protein [Actinomycetota bacterium]